MLMLHCPLPVVSVSKLRFPPFLCCCREHPQRHQMKANLEATFSKWRFSNPVCQQTRKPLISRELIRVHSAVVALVRGGYLEGR